MTDWTNSYKLLSELINLSVSSNREVVKREWYLDRVYYIEDWDNLETCLCWQYPIKEVCIIKNRYNQNTTIVWNVCVNKFIEHLDSSNIFDWLRRVLNNLSAWPSKELIEYSFEKWFINEWEHDFCIDRYWKRRFNKKQMERREIINKKMISYLNR